MNNLDLSKEIKTLLEIFNALDGKQVIIAEPDEVVVRLNKTEAACLVDDCPNARKFTEKYIKLIEGCPNSCAAYQQLKAALEAK